MASLSTLLDELEDTLTDGSFAFIVGAQDFSTIVISQSTVEKIYPKRTGMEEQRVAHSTANGSIVSDRRNQKYFQSTKELDNANWQELAVRVQELTPGEHSSTAMNITLTGDEEPTMMHASKFHIFFGS